MSSIKDEAAGRKRDHINLALQSKVEDQYLDGRFYYEPLLSAHPEEPLPSIEFVGKKMRAPIWVSSMTGGTAHARKINKNLAKVCSEFGMGMGLGSCRSLLDSDKHFEDFDIRDQIGDELPLFANLGIAQVEELIANNESGRIRELVESLRADGLILHVNPLQEWLQPEGDVISKPPMETVRKTLELLEMPLIVKEVGQGFGPSSMKALLELPLAAVEFAAAGGTNFSKLEMARGNENNRSSYQHLARIGHSAVEMVSFYNEIHAGDQASIRTPTVIISGGVSNFLDGYYLIEKINCTAVYGQASAFLTHAKDSYESLADYVQKQVDGLRLARSFLTIRE
jgi:isopentenyl-diphosphate delta-isomerase